MYTCTDYLKLLAASTTLLTGGSKGKIVVDRGFFVFSDYRTTEAILLQYYYSTTICSSTVVRI